MKNLRRAPLAALAIGVGLVVMLGYFVDLPLLSVLRQVFLLWGVILAAVAILVGVANLARVHWNRVLGRQPGGVYSLIMLLSFILTLVVLVAFGPTSTWGMWIFNNIQVPIESSLLAILAVALAYAAARLLRRKLNLFSLIFVGTVLLVLIGTVTTPWFDLPILGEVRNWIARAPAAAGARGVLLGVALGTVATGLRVLMGVDRPYEG